MAETIDAPPLLSAASVTEAARRRHRRAGELRSLADGLPTNLEPLRLAARRGAAEAELAGAALAAVAEGLGGGPTAPNRGRRS